MKYTKVAKEIIKSYLNSKDAVIEWVSLMDEEAEGKFDNLKGHITAIKNIMEKALKEIEKVESKDEIHS